MEKYNIEGKGNGKCFERDLRGNNVIDQANAFIKILCISNTLKRVKLEIYTLIHNRIIHKVKDIPKVLVVHVIIACLFSLIYYQTTLSILQGLGCCKDYNIIISKAEEQKLK